MPPPRSRAPWAVAACATLLLLATSGRYGPHRDEMYFIIAGRHPDWGYPDQPPLTPLLAAAIDHLAPGSLVALRIPGALIVGAVVILAAELARFLGARPQAQVLVSVVVAGATGVLSVGHLLSTATLDLLVWVTITYAVVRAVSGSRPTWWIVAGITSAIGLQNKTLVMLLLVGLGIGLLTTASGRAAARTPWPWAAAAIAAFGLLPSLVWQAGHAWPQAAMSADIRAEYGGIGGAAELIGFQLLLLGPLGGYLLVVGLTHAVRGRLGEPLRAVAGGYGVTLALLLVLGGKHYYTLGLLVVLATAGAAAIDRRASSRTLGTLTVAAAVLALFPLPAALPVLPERIFASSFYPDMNDDQLNTIGWPKVVDALDSALTQLPEHDRADAVIFTANYGEAGAWILSGSDVPAYSGHNAFAAWGPPPPGAGPVIVIGPDAPSPDLFTECRHVATVDSEPGVEEDGAQVWTCAGPVGSWDRIWPLLTHLSA